MKLKTARFAPPRNASRLTRRAGLAALLIVLATEGLQTAAADGETRSLRIYHTHSRENIDVVFKRNGRYDESGLAKLNHFLRDWRNQEATKMDPRLFDVVWEVYQEVGGREPIQIISAYRSPQTNAMLRRRSRGVAKFSQHMLGKAMDFNIPGVSLEQIRYAGLRLQRGGVGFYPTSGSPFVHLDVGSVRHWPRMAPDAFARVMSQRTPRVASWARNERLQTAAVVEKPKKSWYSRFIPGNDDDDENETRNTPAASAPSTRLTAEAAPARPTQVAAAVPMPRARPRDTEMARANMPASPASIVQSRGLWSGSAVMAAADTPAPETRAPQKATNYVQRLVWQVGAQPVTTARSANGNTVLSKRMPAPRPRPAVVASADTTGSVPWPISDREDRVPSDLVMAYAASSPTPAAPVVAAPAPMGSLRPARATASRKPAAPEKTVAARPMQAPNGRLGDNPWLRGLVLSPSVHGAMDVTVMGVPNYLVLTTLMQKPSAVIANTFANDPEFGLTFEAFSGSAISFIPTIRMGAITNARLD